MDEVRELISCKEYAAAIKKAEASLPHLNNPKQIAEVIFLSPYFENIKNKVNFRSGFVRLYLI